MESPLTVPIFWKDNTIEIQIPNTSNVYDLKKAVEMKTGVNFDRQEWVGLDWVSNTDPVIALGLDGSPIFLVQKEGSQEPPKTVPSFDTPITPSFVTPTYSQPPTGTTSSHLIKSRLKQVNPKQLERILNAVAVDIEVFLSRFEARYGVDHPDFIGGHFTDVFNQCKHENKLLFVVVSNDGLTSKDFQSLVLANPLLKNFLNSVDLPIWVGEANSSLEAEFFKTFGFQIKYPLLLVVGSANQTLKVVDYLESNLLVNELIAHLQVDLQNYSNYLEGQEEESRRRQYERQIREEQNREYTNSLEVDRRKEQVNMSVEAKKDANINILVNARKEAIRKLEHLPPDPNGASSRIGVRLPDGSRIERKFSPDNTLQVLYDWVGGEVAKRAEDRTFIDETSPPVDGEKRVIPWDISFYEFAENFPKRTIDSKQLDKTIKELGLNSAMLFLQRKN